jgi:predicted esterase
MTQLLECVEVVTGTAPTASVIWMHGLGADGYDFVPVVKELDPNTLPGLAGGVRFVFPHAPIRPVTINNGYVMRAWYDVSFGDLEGRTKRADETGVRRSQAQIDELILREHERGIAFSHIVLAGFSQGGAISLQTGLRYPEKLAGVMALGALAWWLTAEARGPRGVVMATAAVAGYASLATVATRPGLTGVLDQYRTTLLDRYYYGTSLLVVVAVCVAASAGLRGGLPARRRAAAAVLAAVLAIYAAHGAELMEFRRSRWPDQPSESFAAAVASAAAAAPADADRVRVPLHPRSWRARFPTRNARATSTALLPVARR